MVSLFLLLSLLCSVQNPSAVPNNPTKQTTQSDVKGKAQDKSTDKILTCTLTASTKPLRVGDYLNIGYRITNVSREVALIPDMLLGSEIYVKITDPTLRQFFADIGSGEGMPTLDSRSGYANTVTLSPYHYWGSDTAIQVRKIS